MVAAALAETCLSEVRAKCLRLLSDVEEAATGTMPLLQFGSDAKGERAVVCSFSACVIVLCVSGARLWQDGVTGGREGTKEARKFCGRGQYLNIITVPDVGDVVRMLATFVQLSAFFVTYGELVRCLLLCYRQPYLYGCGPFSRWRCIGCSGADDDPGVIHTTHKRIADGTLHGSEIRTHSPSWV